MHKKLRLKAHQAPASQASSSNSTSRLTGNKHSPNYGDLSNIEEAHKSDPDWVQELEESQFIAAEMEANESMEDIETEEILQELSLPV
jgi:hypothetical protein